MAGLATLCGKSVLTTRNRWLSVREQPLLKIVFITVFAVSLFVGLWNLFDRGFRFLDAFEGANVLILGRLFALFFFGMGSMIVVSGVVTSYATIFRSDELPFLLTRPLHIREIVLYKFGESIVLASWAFFFIIIPFVGSYTTHRELGLAFPFWTLTFSLPFIVLCSGAGVLVTLLCVRFVPTRSLVQWFALLGLTAIIFGGWYLLQGPSSPEEQSTFLLSRLIPGLRLASHPLLPSWWLSEGVLSFTRGETVRGALLLTVLVSNAAIMCHVIAALGSATFYPSWQRVLASGARRGRPLDLPRTLQRAWHLVLPRDVAAIVVKDLRIFLRDPMQWTQVLVFFGLLALYFTNLRSFHYHMLEPQWKNTIAFLNVFSVSAVMCSLGSRFVYPQLSLEGQQFWIIGLAPTSMARVLTAKFLVALLNMLIIGTGLVALSTYMLDLEAAPRAVALGISVGVAMAIAGLSTGLGAIFIDLRQRNPAAIVSGFGGTLNLVLCLVYMLAVILPFAGPYHLYFHNDMTYGQLRLLTQVAWAWLAALTVAATVIPLSLGRRSLAKREY